MRLLNVTQSYFPFLDKGGPTVKVRALALGMASLGHAVTVLTADFGLDATKRKSLNAFRIAGDMKQKKMAWMQFILGLAPDIAPSPGILEFPISAAIGLPTMIYRTFMVSTI